MGESKKEDKDDKAKDKKKKPKKAKVKSESPEPICLDGEFRDTQISQVEGSKATGDGVTESSQETDRGEVATPTHR